MEIFEKEKTIFLWAYHPLTDERVMTIILAREWLLATVSEETYNPWQ